MATNDQGNRRFDDGTRDAGDWAAGTGNWGESARQVWLAGVGAWTRAQAEGSKLFDSLVRDGMAAERDGTRTHAGGTTSSGTADLRGLASGTWDRMGQFVEDAVQRSLLRLGVPRREDMEALGRRIDALGEELREARASGEGAATRKPPA